MPVFYSTHMYTPHEFANWTSLNGIDKIMFELKMFAQGTWGHDYHPELKPDDNTVVLNPHKGLSNFWTGDAAYESAITNFEFLAHEVVTTKQIIKRIEEAKHAK